MSKTVYITPKGIAGFTSVDKPSQYKDPQTGALSEPKFVASVELLEQDVEDLKNQLQPVLDEYYKEVSKKDKTIKKLPVFAKKLDKATGEETGKVLIKASSKFAVQVTDSKKPVANVLKGVKVNAGSEIKIAFIAKPSMVKKECFLTFFLQAVKVFKLADGTRDYRDAFGSDDEEGFVYGADDSEDMIDGGEEALDKAVNI